MEGLVLNKFETNDSKRNMYIQIADLFVASVNRKLHTPNGNNDKDILADYILGLLKFQINDVNTSNLDSDKSKVFNLTYQE